MRYLLFCLAFSFSAAAQNAFPPIGLWREHLPYQSVIDVSLSETKAWAATPYSLFTVDRSSGEAERFSRVSGLSETGVSTLAYDAVSKKLYIAYTNSNIDVWDAKGLRNIPDVKRSTLSGNKNIFHLYPDGDRCYLSTGLGIVVLDAARYEVKDSWFIGNTGGYVKINAFTKTSQHFYAATEEGLKRTLRSTPNPADFRAWQNLAGSNGLSAAAARGVVTVSGKAVVLQNDSLFAETGSGFSFLFANDFPVLSVTAAENKLVLCQRKASGEAQVLVLNENGTIARTLRQPGVISFPKKAVLSGSDVWVADLFGGLSKFSAGSFERYTLNAPPDVVLGGTAVRAGTFWATAGTVNSSWNYQFNRSGVFRYRDGTWTAYNQFNSPQLDTLLDFITVAVDPRDNSAWAGSFGGGLLHIGADNKLQIFKQASPLGPTIGDPGSYRVSGLAFDAANNLWVANFGAARQLHVRKSDGAWQSFTAPFNLFQNAVGQIVIDDDNQKWIQAPLGNGLLIFNEGNLSITSDDKWRQYRGGTTAGGLPSNEVLCLAKDKSGFIWVGTTNGVAVYQCPGEVFTSGCAAVLPVVKEGSFSAFLFGGQEVRSIAVDGADRKWMATSSGLWLVAPDGDKVLANYTQANSPMLSNDVKSISIDGATGEVFVGTAQGLISFRGSATDAAENTDSVLVFPNPVPPGYSGSIGIRGLPENSTVKITEPNGRLVFQTRALGGQAVWDGRTSNGARAASGVYLVFAVDAANGQKAVGRIVVVK